MELGKFRGIQINAKKIFPFKTIIYIKDLIEMTVDFDKISVIISTDDFKKLIKDFIGKKEKKCH